MPPSDATLGRAGSMSNASGRSISPATNRRCHCGYCAPSSFCTCAASPAPSGSESVTGLQRSSSQMSLTSPFKQLRKQASSTRLDQGAFFHFRRRLAVSCSGLMLVMLCVALASRHLQHASVEGLERVPPFRESRRMMMSAEEPKVVSVEDPKEGSVGVKVARDGECRSLIPSCFSSCLDIEEWACWSTACINNFFSKLGATQQNGKNLHVFLKELL